MIENNNPVPSGDEVRCPQCGSKSISAQKKGFGAGKGCCGTIIFGPLGLLCGAIGANEIELYCINCGNKWKR